MSENLFLSGSNFQSGFTAGTFQIPNEVAPGIPVGIGTPYVIRGPKPSSTFLTVNDLNVIPNTKNFLDLLQIDGTFFEITSTEKMYKFDYSRVVGVKLVSQTVSTDVNVYFSYYDQYGKKGIRKVTPTTEEDNFEPIVACLGIASIYVETTEATEVSLEFNLSNIFELPFTDLGLKSQMLYFSGFRYKDVPAINIPWMVTSNEAELYAFTWDCNYGEANRPDIPITLTTGRPRPWVLILNKLDLFDDSIADYSFVFQQAVYGLGNGTQFNNLIGGVPIEALPSVAANTYDGRYVFGPHNYTEGFEPWKG